VTQYQVQTLYLHIHILPSNNNKLLKYSINALKLPYVTLQTSVNSLNKQYFAKNTKMHLFTYQLPGQHILFQTLKTCRFCRCIDWRIFSAINKKVYIWENIQASRNTMSKP